ncbi:EAL domain-containing protein [Azoarcus sp. KH32C]|uniref:EAL domain-containing protein n=1 Tax=Azoarcus sp. KH32C TaxID=748247 RepID=UPI0002385F7F|nr:EAL domain-containing protein [Azoarcus sp. KH32C]BAL22384.1 diguanylate cyclase/phosphodiesterase with PAS/PAC sensor [Azoarcus sp. KH32C]
MFAERTSELSSLRVLYVEDSETDADLTRRMLSRLAPDIALEIAHSLMEARERLAPGQGLDVVLTDLKLPDGSGLELLAEIRQRQLPCAVVLLTGSGDRNTAIAALKAGADAYLVKQGNYLAELPETLRAALARFHHAPPRPLRPLNVLYAERNERDADLTRRHLAQHHPHLRLTVVRDAADVLAHLPADAGEPSPFDVLLLDYRADGTDSLELARTLREERGLTLPIVLVTAQGSESVIARALDAGITDYIAKEEGYLQALPATLEKVREQAELQHERALLRDTSAHLSHLLAASPVILYTLRMCDGSFIPTWVSDNIERIFGTTPAEAMIPGWWLDHLHPDDRAAALAVQPRLLRDGRLDHEYRFVADNGRSFWIRDQVRLVRKGAGEVPEVIGIWTDITRDKRQELLQSARSAVLNRLVAGDPLPDILDDVVQRLERLEPSMRASILLLDPQTGRLVHGAAPHLPAEYCAAVEGLEPGEGQGSCGTSVYRRQAVFVADVASDPLWARYRDVAARTGFRACWSFPFSDPDGRVLGTFAAYFDAPREPDPALVALIEEFCALTALAVQKVRATDALRQAAAVFETTRDGVMITDLERRIVSVNRAWCEMTGYSADDALGKVPQLFKAGLQNAAFYRRMWAQIARSGYWQGEIWNRRRNGEQYPQWLSVSTVHDAEGTPTHYVGVMTDVSKLRRSEAELERLAHFDPLTDLPNRLLVESRLEHAIEQAARLGSGIGVLFVDLDRFKTVNDSLGHTIGDEVIKSIAHRLREGLRGDDTLARWGGDEFLVIIENTAKPDEAASLAQGLIDRMQQPFQLSDGQLIYVGASIGVSLYPQDARTAAALIQHADTALNQAKAQGRNTYRFFTDAMTLEAQHHLDLERRLRRALEQQAFVVHYQPQIDLASGRLTGCEALLRWHDPQEGLIPPGNFIPFAEETGLIVPIGEWALETACAQARRWLDAGLPALNLAVNLSARQLWQTNLPERIAEILARTGLPPGSLELELTESMIMGHEPEAVERLGQLRRLGLKLAIDDFGTGYSSLSYLKNLPIEVLKIDQSFVRGIPQDRKDMEIAAGIIALARKLNLRVLAEGVETAEQLAFLREQGCDSYQGYLFSRPLPAEEFEKLLAR